MTAPKADVCMVLEGSYPYVRGGVSTWTDDLIRSLSHLTFHLWCIVARSEDMVMRYTLPPNVTGVTNVILYEGELPRGRGRLPPELISALKKFHQLPESPDRLARRCDVLWNEVVPMLEACEGGVPAYDLLLGDDSYEMALELYEQRSETLSFIDFFYTYLFSHAPLVRLLAEPVPPARLYHTISTGFAGFVAAHARRKYRAPMLLTEHGIYTNERMVEISLADWIFSRKTGRVFIGREIESLKRVWMRLFDFLGRLTYEEASWITTLYSGNRDMQIDFGAPPHKLEIIPNGVDFAAYEGLARETQREDHPLIALVGRIVPIKDIRTYIKACRVVARRVPNARFLVLGGHEESEEYYKSCLEYVKLLGLQDKMLFPGNVNVKQYYGKLDVVVLTSISEALPLTVLEAMAASVPVVCTRVGACEELVMGRAPEDKALGRAGFVCTIADHNDIGTSIARLLEDKELAKRCGAVGRERAQRFYDINAIRAAYGQLYAKWLGASAAAPASA
jgi:glycosyltransferase involved in cell wall biosynthesis